MRIRSIKPEFWRSEDITSLPISSRLTFIGLWNYADDNGVGDAREAVIAADLYAEDIARDFTEASVRVHDDLNALENAGLIVRYMVGKKRLLHITTWTEHQVINRPSKGHCYPLPTAETVEAYRDSVRPHGGLTEPSLPGAGEQGSRGAGEQGITTLPEPPVPASDAPQPKPKRTTYPPAFDAWWTVYPKHKNGSKKTAHAEWCRAVKLIDPDKLQDLTASYAANPGVSDVTYCPDAHRWLKDHRWETVTASDRHVTEHTRRTGTRPEDWLREPPPEAPWDYIDGEVLDTKELT